ncbi:MAG: hypothetical protein ACYDDY_17055 [Mucilaginibacter sp.]
MSYIEILDKLIAAYKPDIKEFPPFAFMGSTTWSLLVKEIEEKFVKYSMQPHDDFHYRGVHLIPMHNIDSMSLRMWLTPQDLRYEDNYLFK